MAIVNNAVDLAPSARPRTWRLPALSTGVLWAQLRWGFLRGQKAADEEQRGLKLMSAPSGSPASSLTVRPCVSCVLGAVPGAELPVGTGNHEPAPCTVGWSPFWCLGFLWCFVMAALGNSDGPHPMPQRWRCGAVGECRWDVPLVTSENVQSLGTHGLSSQQPCPHEHSTGKTPLLLGCCHQTQMLGRAELGSPASRRGQRGYLAALRVPSVVTPPGPLVSSSTVILGGLL